jgi:ADP-heptose:LPS heptosyltransferase
MNILCICPIGIGNYLLCYPAWVHLHRHLPDANLHLLALRKPILDLADGDPLWSGVHLIEPVGKPGPMHVVRFVRQLAAHRFSASIAFFPSNTWQYNLLPLLAGIRKRHAFRYHRKGFASLSWCNTDRLPVDIQLHDVYQNVALAARFLGNDCSKESIVFPELITEKAAADADALIPAGRYIAIHPGSSAEHGMDAKRWPPERFGLLADRICKYIDATALILGGPDEAVLKQSTAAAMTARYRIVEPQRLRQTAAILKKCSLCLCNDSGIMHLAACSGVPVAALFGPTDERRNGPFGERHCVIRKPLTGFPLWTAANVGARFLPSGINPNQSLQELSVDDAWEKLTFFLQAMKSGR